MIKKILGNIFIIGLGFLNFSNASFSLGIVGQDATSVENQNYDISILSNYEFKTTFGGVNKRLFAPKETEVWWWGTTGNMHYSNVYFTTKYNGIVKYFYICDYIETLNNFSNCTKYLYSSNLEVVKNILNNVSAGDTFFYGQAGAYMEFNAVSIQSLDETIVFPVIAIQRSSAPNENTSISAIGISFNGNDCNNIQSGWWVCNLDNYDNSIGYDFSTLPNNLIGVSPGFPTGGGDGGNTGTGNNWISNNYYCPTFKQIIENQPSNYNTGLCYNGTLKYENGTMTTVQKKDIQTVFTDYEEFTQRINVYYNNCNTPATQNQCENAFNGEREKYSIIANAINNNVDSKGLRNYCNIWLNYDLNATTCTASGYIAEQPTTNELIEYIENIGNIGEIMTPTTGNVLDSLIGSGTTRENREELANRDIFGQLNQIKDKITSIFKNRNGVNGIIPDYILRLILVSLLLTVLLKK